MLAGGSCAIDFGDRAGYERRLFFFFGLRKDSPRRLDPFWILMAFLAFSEVHGQPVYKSIWNFGIYGEGLIDVLCGPSSFCPR